MSDEVKLSPDELSRVMGIVNDAYTEMQEVALGISGQGEGFAAGYNGLGTARGVENYENLGRNGDALARALDGLATDLGETLSHGQNADEEAETLITQASGAQSISNDRAFG